jgi:hypothetical protein
MVYLPAGKDVELDLTRLSGDSLAGTWFDPRTGVARTVGSFPRERRISFTPPGGGPDWVLILDDIERGFGIPGR